MCPLCTISTQALTNVKTNLMMKNAVRSWWQYQRLYIPIRHYSPPIILGKRRTNTWSSPRKDKNRKHPTEENVVPCEQTIGVNPNGGEQGGIPKKESPGIASPKGNPSWRQTELVPRCLRENSYEDLSWRQKELIPRQQQKRRGIPKKEYPGVFTPKYDPI